MSRFGSRGGFTFTVLTRITPGTFPVVHTPRRDIRDRGLWIDPPTTLFHHVRSRLFDQITSLTLNQFSVSPSDPPALERTFCDLTTTVTSLHLLQPMASSPQSLLCLLSVFKNLEDTEIRAPSWKDIHHDVSVADPTQLRGKLVLSELGDESNHFLLLLGSQPTCYETIALVGCSFRSVRPLQQFISTAGKSVRRLQIVAPDHGEHIPPSFACPPSDTRGSGAVPPLSILDCKVLEDVFVSVLGTTNSFHSIPPLLASITSPHFRKIILKLRTTAGRESDAVQISLADGISQLDGSLSHLARNATRINRRVSLVLLGQEPEFLAQGLFDFQELGYIWAGEEVGGGEYSWTFTTPKKGKTRRCVLYKLFRRETS